MGPSPESVRLTYAGGFFTRGRVEDESVDWLVDTGCTSTILSTRIFLKMLPDNRPELIPYDGDLRSANDTRTDVMGRAWVNVQVGKKLVQHRVIVADVTNDGLLGLDFLQGHGITINFATQQILCDGENIAAQVREGTDRACRVFVAEPLLIPARSRTIVEAKTTKPLVSGNWLVEPLNHTPGNQPVIVAKTLARGCGQKLAVELLNPMEHDVSLFRHTSLGVVSRVMEPDVLCTVKEEGSPSSLPTTESPTTKGLEPEVEKILQDVDMDLTEAETQRVRELLGEHRDVFATKDVPFGRTTLVQHEIDTGDTPPIKQAVRRTPFHLRGEAEAEVQ